MTNRPYLFHKTLPQLRRLGARGGKAHARNQRTRRAPAGTVPEARSPRAAPPETAAQAMHLLDAQFPWLRGAEK